MKNGSFFGGSRFFYYFTPAFDRTKGTFGTPWTGQIVHEVFTGKVGEESTLLISASVELIRHRWRRIQKIWRWLISKNEYHLRDLRGPLGLDLPENQPPHSTGADAKVHPIHYRDT